MKLFVVALLSIFTASPALAEELTPGQKEFQAKLRPPKFKPDLGYRPTDNSREKIQAYLDKNKEQHPELENWRKQLEELNTKAENLATGPPDKRGALGRLYEQSCYAPYLQCTFEEERLYLTRFLGTTFPDIAHDSNLSSAIENEYEVVENFLSSYSPTFNAKFETLEKGDESAQKYKQQIILSALAHSLASLRDNTTRVHHPNLFAKNCHCVMAMLGQISKSGKPIPIAAIKLRLGELTKQLTSER